MIRVKKQVISIFLTYLLTYLEDNILKHVQGVTIVHWKNYLLYLYSLKTENAAEVVNDKRT